MQLTARCELTPKPENGNMNCNGTGELGTRCFYTCNKWYKRMGGAASVCLRDGDIAYWTEPAVYCKGMSLYDMVELHSKFPEM